MMKTLMTALLVYSLLFGALRCHAEIKFAVLAQRGPEIALKEYGALGSLLSKKMGETVTIVPVNFTDFLDYCRAEPSSFIFTNPWFYVRAKATRGARALVSVKYQNSGEKFGGVIFTRADSPIRTLADLRGKVLLCPKLSSPGGWLFQKGEIVKAGINPEKDLKFIAQSEKETHDDVVLQIKAGKADVGTVRTNILETMQNEGKITMSDFRVLNEQRHEGFSEVCSTPLYPDWPVASLKNTPPEVAEKMKKALLAIPPGEPALNQARKIERFVEALDYGPIENLCRRLKVLQFNY